MIKYAIDKRADGFTPCFQIGNQGFICALPQEEIESAKWYIDMLKKAFDELGVE